MPAPRSQPQHPHTPSAPDPRLREDWLFAPYTSLPQTSSALIPLIHKLCGERPIDLLLHLPVSFAHRRPIQYLEEATAGETVVIKLRVMFHSIPKNRRQPYTVTLQDAAGAHVQALFFNHGTWLQKAFEQGKEVTLVGEVAERSLLKERQMVHPELAPTNRSAEEAAGAMPVYPLTTGITQNVMRRVIKNTYEKAAALTPSPLTAEWLPSPLKQQHNFPDFLEALRAVHFPPAEAFTTATVPTDPHHPARTRLAFDEFLAWQLAFRTARAQTRSSTGIAHTAPLTLQEKFLSEVLPFQLTDDQRTTIQAINADLVESSPMVRLVQGDVGSGKTVVAFAAALKVIAGGNQAILMAPTEILAAQHGANAEKWLTPLGVRSALLTGRTTAKEKRLIKQSVANGEVDLLIGTHALIQDDVTPARLGLAIVDEQHRFGVKQRLTLTSANGSTPDLLVMSATPIPRTLSLTLYGDMDISLIKQKPPGRLPIDTRVFPLGRLRDIVISLERVLEKDEQIYWVCPLVEENEKLDLAAAEERFAALEAIYGEKVGLLHGKMKGKEKEAILDAFRKGERRILVSTTVIEVGVDVPQATVMVIEHAERFGLAQLHQLRGRVGRGGGQATCLLLHAHPLSEYGRARLEAMRQSDDGFFLAEKDLELRGPGEVLGTQQAGRMPLRAASFEAHRDLIPEARETAENLVRTVQPNTPAAEALAVLLKVFGKHDVAGLFSAG